MIRIAIDGPAGAGKSTMAKALAKRLGVHYLDTGAMYRGVAVAILERNASPRDEKAVKEVLAQVDIRVVYEGDVQYIFVGDRDVTPYLRTPEVSAAASAVAVFPAVREKLVALQRQTAEEYDIVMDGRDIGTFVLPDAPVKFYVTASSRERARRRLLEMQPVIREEDLNRVEEEIIARDHQDMNREFAPLCQAEDALFVDTTHMGIEETLDMMIARVKEVYPDVL